MKEQLLSFIAETVRERYEKHKSPTNGAGLAELIRAEFPGSPLADAGFEKLGDAVREASERGLLVRNSAAKHLEVFPPDVPIESVVPSSGDRPQYVRPDAWRAFAMQFENQFVYYNEQTREFEVRPLAASGSGFLEVSPPTDGEFRSWIEEFSKDESVPVPDNLLQSSHCLREFSVWIGKQSASAAVRWKRFRAAKVVQAIIDWGKQSSVDTSEFFAPVVSRGKRESARGDAQSVVDEDVRSAVIACIRDMSAAEIESLSIPLRHVVTHFRPRS